MRFRTTGLLLVCVLVAASCGGGSSAAPDTTTTSAVPTTAAPPARATTTTPQPTTTTTTSTTTVPPPELAAGVLCRDVRAAGYGFADALAYFVREGMPDRMDEDGDGIPCETVYPAVEIDTVLNFDAVATIPTGRFCRDVDAAGFGFADALAYWVREGEPARMDADGNGLPCETVYDWGDIVAVMGFDGASYESPEAPPGVTIGAIVADVQATLQARFDADPDHPAGVLGPEKVVCDDTSRRVARGDVFVCTAEPQTSPDLQLDQGSMVFLVLDDQGTVSMISGTDMPGSTAQLWEMYEQTPSGLMCRDLLEQEPAGFFSACCSTPLGNYFMAMLYWFMEGMPDRMDADGDGIPCETVFAREGIDAVLSGGGLSAP